MSAGEQRSVVIVGAGQGGVTAAVSLRENGWTGAIHVIGDEADTPYQRPPLSKGYLNGSSGTNELLLRSLEQFRRDEIDLRLGVKAESLDRSARRLVLSDGNELEYDALILATGSSARKLDIPGAELDGVHAIRTIADADALRSEFAGAERVLIIGAGFLGLEVASQAVKSSEVLVLEFAPQILGRVLSREMAEAIEQRHAESGVEIRCGAHVEELIGIDGRVNAAVLSNGERISVDSVVVSVGGVARDELARSAGLAIDGGIVVNDRLVTSDSSVFAIGDCAKYPNVYAGTEMRVESVQNATDQARYVAKTLTGGNASGYMSVPWFWSSQGTWKLQIAGIAMPADEARVAEKTEGGRLVVERLRDGRVIAVETIDAPASHMKARKHLAGLFG